MQYYNLKSIISSRKFQLPLKNETDSFSVAPRREDPYIEPSFKKIEFSEEKPTVLLVSAVGATGKTALAQVLSQQLGMPLLDLASHKPVGDNTLSGLLTSSYNVADLTKVFEGLQTGEYAVIIDGIDEGRSKTTELAFHAFLDDVAKLAGGSPSTSFVLLGRTQILEDCWLYLSDSGLSTGLISIQPFDLESARKYIDAFTHCRGSSHEMQYLDARDQILDMLKAAFGAYEVSSEDDFLSFIGYPPVLDAIVTLLKEEHNYHKLMSEIGSVGTDSVEVTLLHKIALYILNREREEKVIPNILAPLTSALQENDRRSIIDSAFSLEEQCLRLLAHCNGKAISLGTISDVSLNQKYEERLKSWLPEHPYISGRSFRNAVFESIALAMAMISKNSDLSKTLIKDYASRHKRSYHLVYLLEKISSDGHVPSELVGLLLESAAEFQSIKSAVELNIESAHSENFDTADESGSQIEIQIEIQLDKDQRKLFSFSSSVVKETIIPLGRKLGSAFISVPCKAAIAGEDEIEFVSPLQISATEIQLGAASLVVKSSKSENPETQNVILIADNISSLLERITTNGVDLSFVVPSNLTAAYPIIQYIEHKDSPPDDPMLSEKYLRIRRILMEFRSHSKGTLARYRAKIEHERMLKGQIGWSILNRLIDDQILTLSGSFYFLHPEGITKHLGVSWLDLRKGRSSTELLEYLGSIQVDK